MRSEDYNSWDEAEVRRGKLAKWLLRAWEWCEDNNRPQAAEAAAQLVSHAEEPDFPLFEEARRNGLIGAGKLADVLRQACGIPTKTLLANGWEREINYSPVIWLDEKLWHGIHQALGWVNRDHDTRMGTPCFWLVSAAGNQVRFAVRRTVPRGDWE